MPTIKEHLEGLLNSVTGNCKGLFSESQRYHKQFEKGKYACAVLRPTRRMRSNIGVNRELLLVASNFKDQQQRILKFVMQEIQKSQGRFENTIAMIVHLDGDGNQKLRNWGREFGISIIAINANKQIESEEDLERRLSSQLYSHDPFDVSGPVSSDYSFFGRRDEAIDLARKLQNGQIRSCLGIRKIGKTSIINRVLLEIEKSQDCTCVMTDCSRDEVFEASAEVLMTSLAYSIDLAREMETGYSNLEVQSRGCDLVQSREHLAQSIASTTRPVILIFDEIDYITPGSPTSRRWKDDFNRFWRSLRTIYQECSRSNSTLSILISGVSTYWFTVEEIGGIENAALAFVPDEFLSPMAQGASVAMLKRLGRISGLAISDEAAKHIAISTGNIPFWSRKCGSFIHRHLDTDSRPTEVGIEATVSLVRQFIREEGSAIAEVALTHLFRVHPEMADAAKAVSQGKYGEISPATFRTLSRYGIATAAGEFSGAMISAAYESLGSAVLESEAGRMEPRREDSLRDWAEDLSVLGRRRNILEKRLRAITLNFIRADALQNNKLQELRDSILKHVRSGKRPSLANVTAEELMERLDWLELSRIIMDRWELFEVIFGDRREFRSNSSVINERPDAHAKEFDQADFALYRRALTSLEKAISKLG